MKLNWALFCRRGLVDQKSRLPTAIDIFERVTFTPILGLATLPMEFALALNWGLEPNEETAGERTCQVRMSVGSKVLAEPNVNIVFDESRANTSFIHFSAIPVTHKNVTFAIWNLEKNKKVKVIKLRVEPISIDLSQTIN